jgi:hypothetical protein
VNAMQSEDWRAPIVAAVRGYYEAEDGVTNKRVAIRARNYHIIDDNLYRKGVCAPLLKCISATEGKQLLHEIHSGMSSHHLGTRALVQKAFRQGFYWPSAVADAHDIVRQCPECQRHAPLLDEALTSSVHYRQHPGITPTLWWRWSTFPSG